MGWRQLGPTYFPLALAELGLSIFSDKRKQAVERGGTCPDMPKSIKTGDEEERERASLRNNSGEEGRGGTVHIVMSKGERAREMQHRERRPGQKKDTRHQANSC